MLLPHSAYVVAFGYGPAHDMVQPLNGLSSCSLLLTAAPAVGTFCGCSVAGPALICWNGWLWGALKMCVPLSSTYPWLPIHSFKMVRSAGARLVYVIGILGCSHSSIDIGRPQEREARVLTSHASMSISPEELNTQGDPAAVFSLLFVISCHCMPAEARQSD